MSVEITKEVMMRYFNADHDDVSMLAEDVVFTTMANGQEYQTPGGVLGLLHFFYNEAFAGTAETRNVVFADGNAVWEGDLVGRHVGEFSGIPATGKEVRVPLCVVYDVQDGKLKRARIYMEMPVLLRQLGKQNY